MLRVFALLFGTIWVMTIAMLVSMPISIVQPLSRRVCQTHPYDQIDSGAGDQLAGVPSIVFGMFGLAIFVKQGGVGFGLGASFAAGSAMGGWPCRSSSLPVKRRRSVPRSLRESAYSVGCTQWQVTRPRSSFRYARHHDRQHSALVSRIMVRQRHWSLLEPQHHAIADPEPLAGLTGGNVNSPLFNPDLLLDI